MVVKSMFESGVKEEILQRLEKLSPASQAQWGKMNVAQMMAHCSEVMKLAVSSKPYKLTWLGFFIGHLFKKQLYSEKPFSQNLPTAPNFKMVQPKEFEAEKVNLVGLINKLVENGKTPLDNKMHPIFGKFTADQWGISQWKHLDHHFRQFGA